MSTGAASILRAGRLVSDREFDQVYPPALRFVSHQQWTPVKVATRAARLLVDVGASQILDVGSGPGKFCIVGALTTSAHFAGIEQRPHLVTAARTAADEYQADRTRFIHGNVVDVDFGSFDGFYFYNPFHEQICSTSLPIDDAASELVQVSPLFYRTYLVSTIAKLAGARPGTAVVTYHGFGGQLPSDYLRVHQENIGSDKLVMWVKKRSSQRFGGH